MTDRIGGWVADGSYHDKEPEGSVPSAGNRSEFPLPSPGVIMEKQQGAVQLVILQKLHLWCKTAAARNQLAAPFWKPLFVTGTKEHTLAD